MNLPQLIRSATLPLQVLISGSIQDSLTPGESPRSPVSVELYEINPVTGKRTECSLKVKVFANGAFSFFGVPETAFPRLGEKEYDLQLEASAPNYETRIFDFNIGPINGQPELVARPIPFPEIPDVQIKLLTSNNLPRTNISLSMNRKAVRLRGQVIEQNNLSQGVKDATVSVASGSNSITAFTDRNGKYEFSALMPVRTSILITASATGFDSKTFEYELNYNQPSNSLLISLNSTI